MITNENGEEGWYLFGKWVPKEKNTELHDWLLAIDTRLHQKTNLVGCETQLTSNGFKDPNSLKNILNIEALESLGIQDPESTILYAEIVKMRNLTKSTSSTTSTSASSEVKPPPVIKQATPQIDAPPALCRKDKKRKLRQIHESVYGIPPIEVYLSQGRQYRCTIAHEDQELNSIRRSGRANTSGWTAYGTEMKDSFDNVCEHVFKMESSQHPSLSFDTQERASKRLKTLVIEAAQQQTYPTFSPSIFLTIPEGWKVTRHKLDNDYGVPAIHFENISGEKFYSYFSASRSPSWVPSNYKMLSFNRLEWEAPTPICWRVVAVIYRKDNERFVKFSWISAVGKEYDSYDEAQKEWLQDIDKRGRAKQLEIKIQKLKENNDELTPAKSERDISRQKEERERHLREDNLRRSSNHNMNEGRNPVDRKLNGETIRRERERETGQFTHGGNIPHHFEPGVGVYINDIKDFKREGTPSNSEQR
eukprot:TRINITY_DN3569_c0_g1_i2.p1 TRINITY_DN3569_c0_g1~~TRINITY_DN3569_c0_g1_i2.p1  ORF type:complete len:476 (-),score=68.30 TRINITY_DN3569_c0_g1_i2:104-1531(-)